MTYLSQLILNARSREVQRDLSDCHALHRTVLAAFPDVPDGQSARDHFDVLHRVDAVQRPGMRVTLLVQSAVEPAWNRLPVGYLATPTEPAVKRVDDAYGRISTGSTLRFRLRANPTKRVAKVDEGMDARWKGKRVDLRREDDQVAWLKRKGNSNLDRPGGFQLLAVAVRADVPNVSVIPGGAVHGKHRGSRLTFGSVLFDGVLRVTDADAFRGALVHGIGSGKAYGFGLLSVGPA